MSYLLRCPECASPVGLVADANATCKCGAKIVSVGTPTHANPPLVTGVPGSWWASWNGLPPEAALAAQTTLETKNAAVTAKLLEARAETMARQEIAAYTTDKPKPAEFAVPAKKKP